MIETLHSANNIFSVPIIFCFSPVLRSKHACMFVVTMDGCSWCAVCTHISVAYTFDDPAADGESYSVCRVVRQPGVWA